MGEFLKNEVRKLWIPLQKSKEGTYRAFLSDDSIDRDDELMSKELLVSWANNKALPILVDHKNQMENFVGGWTDLKVIDKGNKHALSAKYKFFSQSKAQEIKRQVEEAVDMGLNPGVSIGAIPKSYDEIEIKGKTYKRWKSAELLEASFIPIQSNRGSYAYMSKGFDLNKDNKEVIQKMAEENNDAKKKKEDEDKKKEDDKNKRTRRNRDFKRKP